MPASATLTFSLPPMLTIETVDRLAAALSALPIAETKAAQTMQLDASLVEAITTPGMQLLLALQKTLTDAGGSVQLSGLRASCVEALRAAGMEKLLTHSPT